MIDLRIPAGIRFILNTLQKGGHEGYLAGGSIRSALLREEVQDWDIATRAEPAEIAGLFRKTRPLGMRHETLLVTHQKMSCQVTPFRSGKPGKRGKDIAEDLAHRDFTINAMAFDPIKGKFLDPFGGIRDLQKKMIRGVREPERRFQEDPLRILRAVRLTCLLHFKITKNTLSAMRKLSNSLKIPAPERIRDELMKIMGSEKPSLGIELMRRTGILKTVLPELLEGYRMKQREQYHAYDVYRHSLLTADILPRDPILRMAGLLHDIGKPPTRTGIKGEFRFIGHEEAGEKIAGFILRRLRFSNRDRARIIHLVRHHGLQYQRSWTDSAVRRLMKKLGGNEECFLLFRADKEASGKGGGRIDDLDHLQKRILKISVKKEPVRVNQLAINGNDVISLLGVQPGKKIGEALDYLLEAVLEDPGKNTPSALKDILLREWKGPCS